jgi:hypothetical protein
MNLSDQIFIHYLEQPRTYGKPAKVNKILEKRIRKFRYIREARLSVLEE